jgi:hypothetical protein
MRSFVQEITLDDIESLAVGAWILGTGGGGSPLLGLLDMRRLYADGHRVGLDVERFSTESTHSAGITPTRSHRGGGSTTDALLKAIPHDGGGFERG